ncbi:hypothetical protein V5O48_019326, partial [Marasmius crinis-equi]
SSPSSARLLPAEDQTDNGGDGDQYEDHHEDDEEADFYASQAQLLDHRSVSPGASVALTQSDVLNTPGRYDSFGSMFGIPPVVHEDNTRELAETAQTRLLSLQRERSQHASVHSGDTLDGHGTSNEGSDLVEVPHWIM